MKVVRRTFEALKFPKGSTERDRLNLDWLTSEYMTSHRYGVRASDGGHTPFTYRTKAEAEARAAKESLPSMGADGDACRLYGHRLTTDGAYCQSCGQVF